MSVYSEGSNKLEELELAAGICKEMIVQEGEDKSDKRRKLVSKLVDIRLEMEQLREEVENADSMTMRKVCSHEFMMQGSSGSGRNAYCEVCLSSIWRVVQRWYRCRVCGFRVHDKCLPSTRRICASALIGNGYSLKLCEERGLSAQDFRCAECAVKIAYASDNADRLPRLCDYTGLYYCAGCHWNDEMVIPARVVHNWDFEKRLVCRASKQLLVLLQRKPIIDLQSLNPYLFDNVDDLKRVQLYRRNILLMKCYFMCCKHARRLRLLLHLHRRQHFVENADQYSLKDLRDLLNGRLISELDEINAIFMQHIKVECVTCQGNGFICERCNDNDIIYPFDADVSICARCCAVSHRYQLLGCIFKCCFNNRHCSSDIADQKEPECRRCVRRSNRRATGDTFESVTDIGTESSGFD